MRRTATMTDIKTAALEKLNPFGAVDENGQARLFNSPREAYLDIIRVMRREFPKGYVDLVLFAVIYQGATLCRAKKQVGPKQAAIIRWSDSREKRYGALRIILPKFIKATGCRFDDDMLKSAMFSDDQDVAALREHFENAIIHIK